MTRLALEPAGLLVPDPRWALFLDVDGTLVPFADTPDKVRPDAAVCRLLPRLQAALGGAVALISGRSARDLDALFAPLSLPLAGLHGLEHRDARGRLQVLGEAGALDYLRAPLRELAESHEGLLLEDKGRALALHFRLAPGEAPRVQEAVAGLVEGSGDLRLIHGKMVIEIKPRHADKGSAVRAFMAEAPFLGRIPVFLGDDVTDEDAFRSVNDMGGLSIHIRHGGAAPDTAAHYRLEGVDQTVHWLARIPEALETMTEERAP